jgi:hypothetical protein
LKAIPVILIYGQGYQQCAVEDAKYVMIDIPGPSGRIHLPVILQGSRDGTNAWTWNGSVDSPTLRPSVLTEGFRHPQPGSDPYLASNWKPYRCHTWINDGCAIFLDDCNHEYRGQTLPLLDVTL